MLRDREEKVQGAKRVRELLKKLGVNPQTVLVVIEGEIVTEDHELKDGDVVTLIDVISGG